MLVILNPKGESVGVLVNDVPDGTPYMNDVLTETLENFGLTLEFDVPADSPFAPLIENEGFVVYKNIDGIHQLFKIKEVFKSNEGGARMLSVYAENSAISEIVTQPIRPVQFIGQTLEHIAPVILANTDWEIGQCTFSGVRDVVFDDYTTALDALQTIVKAFDAEVEFEVKLHGSQVVQRLVHFRRRGTFTGKIFEYAKDMQGIKRTEDSKNLVTALIGVGKADNDGNVMTIGGASVSDPSGYGRNGDFIYSEEAFQKYNRNGRHVFGIFKDDTATNSVELYHNTLAKLKELETPLVNYEADTVLLESIIGYEHEKVRLGDTLFVKDFSFAEPMIVEARVIKLTRSKHNPLNDKVELGNFIPRDFTRSDSIQKMQQKIFLNEQAWSSAGQVANEAKQIATNVSRDFENVQGDLERAVDSVADMVGTVDNLNQNVGRIETELEDLNGVIAEQSDTISVIDERTTGTRIAEVVLTSQSYLNDLAQKANIDDLGVYITHERVSEISDELRSEMVELVENVDLTDYATKAEVTATANQLDFKFSSSGGVNLLKNSTGFAGKDFWSSVLSTETIQTEELAIYGIGSGFRLFGNMGILRQTVNLAIDTTYTLSTICRKPSDGYAHLKVTFNNGDTMERLYTEGREYDYVHSSITFRPTTSGVVTVELYAENTSAIFTGTMLNVGEVPLQWQHSAGEVYNTNVLMDMNGIRVNSNQYNGYTAITPQEFAGYAEVNGQMVRVFTLNNDVTEVRKLDAEEQISMTPIKLVGFTGARNGWAWLPE